MLVPKPAFLRAESMLACSQRPVALPRPGNRHWPSPVTDPKIVVERLPRLLGQLEPNRPTGLPLPDIRSVDSVAIGCHVIDAERDEIAAAQFAVDG
jgi:hypothetical protein